MKLLPYIPHKFNGRGYPACKPDSFYQSKSGSLYGEVIGYHPGCQVCNQHGYILDFPKYDPLGLSISVDCPECGGFGWAPWIIMSQLSGGLTLIPPPLFKPF